MSGEISMAKRRIHYNFYHGADAGDWFESKAFLFGEQPPVPRIGEKVSLRERFWMVRDVVHFSFEGQPEVMIVVQYTLSPEEAEESVEDGGEVVVSPEEAATVHQRLELYVKDKYITQEQADSLAAMQDLTLAKLKRMLSEGVFVASSGDRTPKPRAEDPDPGVCLYCGDTTGDCAGGEECPFYEEPPE